MVAETQGKAEAAAEGAIAAIDTGGDGTINKEECAAAGHSPEQVAATYKKMDKDNDGELTKTEVS